MKVSDNKYKHLTRSSVTCRQQVSEVFRSANNINSVRYEMDTDDDRICYSDLFYKRIINFRADRLLKWRGVIGCLGMYISNDECCCFVYLRSRRPTAISAVRVHADYPLVLPPRLARFALTMTVISKTGRWSAGRPPAPIPSATGIVELSYLTESLTIDLNQSRLLCIFYIRLFLCLFHLSYELSGVRFP